MLSSLRKFISWLFLKAAFGAFIVAAATGFYALWLFDDDDDFSASRDRYLDGLAASRQEAAAAKDGARADWDRLRLEAAAREERAAKAGAIAAGLEETQSLWDRLWRNPEQWRINDRRIAQLRTWEADARREAKHLRSETTRASVVLARRSDALDTIETEQAVAGWSASPAYYYVFRSWSEGRWLFLGLAGAYWLGPLLYRLGLFFYFAPRIGRSRPLQLARAPMPFPWLGECRAGVDVSLWPGEAARVRRRFLESVEEGVAVRRRLFMSWRFPVTSLLAGFVHDVEVRNPRAGRDYRVSFSHHKNPTNEMAVVHVPEGGSLVVRPSFLAGAILPPGEKLRFRRRWQLWRWQAWLTGQLRYIEFTGPCRLVVAGRPGLRAERLEPSEDGSVPSCRAAQDRIVGFTPNLEYRLVRSARFWSYLRWNAPLFDATFTGVGFVLIQTSQAGRRRGLLAQTRHRARRILGL